MLLSINPQFLAILERSQRRLEAEGGLSSDEVRKRLGLARKGQGRTRRSRRRPKTGRA
jgi:hypothetical protein